MINLSYIEIPARSEFSVATKRIYKSVSVRRYVRWYVCSTFVFWPSRCNVCRVYGLGFWSSEVPRGCDRNEYGELTKKKACREPTEPLRQSSELNHSPRPKCSLRQDKQSNAEKNQMTKLSMDNLPAAVGNVAASSAVSHINRVSTLMYTRMHNHALSSKHEHLCMHARGYVRARTCTLTHTHTNTHIPIEYS